MTKEAKKLSEKERRDLFQQFLCAALSACAYSIGHESASVSHAFSNAHRMLARYEAELADGVCP